VTSPEQKLPPASFDVLVQVLAAPCMVHLGIVANPATGKVERNLEQARWTIDLLHVLEEKTRQNLTAAERSRMDQLLHQLRTAYATSSKA
jgi:hypothetical protein